VACGRAVDASHPGRGWRRRRPGRRRRVQLPKVGDGGVGLRWSTPHACADLGCRHPLALGRRAWRPPIPARLRLTDRRAASTHADQRCEFGAGLVDHLVSPCWARSRCRWRAAPTALGAFLDLDHLAGLSSSPARRSFSFRSQRSSRSRGSAGCRPAGLPSARSAPRSRCLRHSEISLCFAECRRGPEHAREPQDPVSGVVHGARRDVRAQETVARRGHRGGPSHPLSAMIQQLDLPHRRSTQRIRRSPGRTATGSTIGRGPGSRRRPKDQPWRNSSFDGRWRATSGPRGRAPAPAPDPSGLLGPGRHRTSGTSPMCSSRARRSTSRR
jgi:hypothetical protein